MFQRALTKSSYEKKMLQKWLVNVHSCTRNVSPKINMDC